MGTFCLVVCFCGSAVHVDAPAGQDVQVDFILLVAALCLTVRLERAPLTGRVYFELGLWVLVW